MWSAKQRREGLIDPHSRKGEANQLEKCPASFRGLLWEESRSDSFLVRLEARKCTVTCTVSVPGIQSYPRPCDANGAVLC
jgi:hypothetical protein